ncbi:hypothetical protein [Nonomuraea sp. NPDC049750]|uniref:hypothetical protein n=1 Tax=Nonomuraea sp. NPDC049750 TaxID=3154738 RepID=UPI0033F8B17F
MAAVADLAGLNTILIQTVVRDAKWRKKLTPVDLRGLSALFWTHLNLYGRLEAGHEPAPGAGWPGAAAGSPWR